MYTPSRFIRNCALVALVFSSHMAFSQAGPKWATEGNLGDAASFVGTTNAFSLLFKTNNVQWMSLNTTGILQVNSLAGSGTGFATLDADGNLYRTSFPNDPYQVLTGNGTFSTFSSVGGWAFNGSHLYNSNTGYVGIGTNNPQYLLDVNGDARVNGTLYALGLVLATKMQADTMKSTTMISVNNNLNFNGGLLNEIYTYNGDIRMQSRVGYNGNTILNAGTTGNVGVGIYAPQYKLDVNGDVRVSGKIYLSRILAFPGDSEIHFGDSSFVINYNTSRIFNNDNSHGVGIGQNAFGAGGYSTAIGYRVVCGTNANNSITIGSGTSSLLTNNIANSLMIGFNSNIPTLFMGPATGINTIGKVGIGTTNPRATFQVGDAGNSVTIGDAPNVGTTFSISYVGFNVARSGPNAWTTANASGNNGGVVLLGTMGGGLRFVGIQSTSSSSPQNLLDGDIQNNTRMYIQPNGRVVIGTQEINSASLYNDAFTRMTVDGRVMCKDVVVSTGADWPDYVFDSTYVLTPLDSVGDFISVNKHLPGSRPAQFMEQNGISLSETVIVQQKQMEEQMLYILQLDARMKVLEEENAKLKSGKRKIWRGKKVRGGK